MTDDKKPRPLRINPEAKKALAELKEEIQENGQTVGPIDQVSLRERISTQEGWTANMDKRMGKLEDTQAKHDCHLGQARTHYENLYGTVEKLEEEVAAHKVAVKEWTKHLDDRDKEDFKQYERIDKLEADANPDWGMDLRTVNSRIDGIVRIGAGREVRRLKMGERIDKLEEYSRIPEWNERAYNTAEIEERIGKLESADDSPASDIADQMRQVIKEEARLDKLEDAVFRGGLVPYQYAEIKERIDGIVEIATGREVMRLEMDERIEALEANDKVRRETTSQIQGTLGLHDDQLGRLSDRIKDLEEHNEKWDATLAVFDAEQIAQGFAAHRAALAKSVDRIEVLESNNLRLEELIKVRVRQVQDRYMDGHSRLEAIEDNWLRMTKAATPKE